MRRLRLRFTMRTMLVVVTGLALFLTGWSCTKRFGLEAVDQLELVEFGEPYMRFRTDSPRSHFPFFITTGFTTTVHNPSTGDTYRQPISRRYYVWIGRVMRIGEWHRSRDC